MSVEPTTFFTLIIALTSSALILGMILLTLLLGGNRVLSRHLALMLGVYLVGNILAIVVWPFSASATQLSPALSQLIMLILGVALCGTGYLGFRLGITLLGRRRWTRPVHLVLGDCLLILTTILAVDYLAFLVQGVPAIQLTDALLPLSIFVFVYLLLCNASLALLYAQQRRRLPPMLFLTAFVLFVVAELLVPISLMQMTNLSLLLGTVASLLLTVGIVRIQLSSPSVPVPQEPSKERDNIALVHHAAEQMLVESELEPQLRIIARCLHDLGWGRVRIDVRDTSAVILEPSDNDFPSTPAEQLWASELGLEQETIGYLWNPQGARNPVPASRTWNSGDVYLVPLRLSTGRIVAAISLSDPVDQQLPSEADTRLLGILETQARSALENNRLLNELILVADQLQEQIEELVMVQRVDQELSATLNFDNVMMLTMDWALRRTGATAGMLNMLIEDESALIPVAALGYPNDIISSYIVNNPIPLKHSIVGRAVQTGETQIVPDVQADPDYLNVLETTRSQVAVPLEMRGRVLGVLNLESDQLDGFDVGHVSFVQRLSGRAAVAMDNARLYREADNRADEMSALYSAARVISSSLERPKILSNIAQSLAAVLNVSSSITLEFSSDRGYLVVNAVYQLGTARNTQEIMPMLGERFALSSLPEIKHALDNQRVLTAQISDPELPASLEAFLDKLRCNSILVTPINLPDESMGAAIAIEGRRPRQFSDDDILMAESLISQGASALRQAKLYEEVRELENMKSEMIRMASHDLRNPLGNAVGYFELLITSFIHSLSSNQREYIDSIRRSNELMQNLIEDLLTLERVESERQSAWVELDFEDLVQEVVDGQQTAAELKRQSLRLDLDHVQPIKVFGSKTQLRQAVTNFVNNAIKYTPDEGWIRVKLSTSDDLITFEVEDNGYGISEERQGKLFQRFYRAREEVTDHIPGTGLGLSLVKTVVERHGGKVWVRSALGKGSTFGFSLPLMRTAPDAHTELDSAVLHDNGKA